MRIETIETVKNIIEKQRMDSNTPKFTSGEIFSAEVAEKTGDYVMLRRMDGWSFLARVMRDMGMQSGDKVEVIVKDVVDGKQVLQVLDIDKQGEQGKPNAQPGAAAGEKMLGSAQAQDPGVRNQMLMNTMLMLKQNATLGPKMAAFLAQNNISNTPENVAALGQMVRGEQTVETLLLDLVELQPQPEQPADTAQTNENGQVQTGQAQSGNQGSVPPQPMSGGEAQQNVPIMPDGTAAQRTAEGGQQTQPGGEAVHVEAVPTEAGSTEAAPTQATPTEGQQAILPENSEMAQPQPSQTSLDTQIARQIRAMFSHLGEGEKNGAEIKKDVKTLPMKLKALMTMLGQAQSKDKDAMAQKADALERQFSLMAEAKRFFCLQLPFVLPDETRRNAELFVYKHGGRKNELDAENIVILLGLDTQYIGRVETLIKVAGKSVSLQFHMDDPAMFADRAKSEKQLAAVLGEAGYRLSDIRVEKLEQRTTVLNAESVLAGQAGTSIGELDIRI